MTIQEAIKSGKRFGRKGWSAYPFHPPEPERGKQMYNLDPWDILQNDWELEREPEQKIELTKKQIKDAYQMVIAMGPYRKSTTAAYEYEPFSMFHFLSKLGFKDD